MKALINALKTMFEAGITAGRITAGEVFKGINNDPFKVPLSSYPYIALDVGGERVEEINGAETQKRVKTVLIEFAVQVLDTATALDNLLDLIDQCKAELERSANRTTTGEPHTWAKTITHFAWGNDENFFRGAQVQVDYFDIEDRYIDY